VPAARRSIVAADEPIPGLALMRLVKYLAHAGVASRRESERIVADGRVRIDGQTVTDPARAVADSARVEVDGLLVGGAEARVTYALHKPVGVVSTARDTHGRTTVLDLLPAHGARLYPIGRLDADSSGLILLSNDGELANRLTHPRFEVDKSYRATLAGPAIDDAALGRLRRGIELDDGTTAPAAARRLGPHELELTIHEGRNRQVRRMCAALGRPVLTLRRERFGPLRLGALKEGQHRRLEDAELEALRRL
jgi:23S rRNA pseudouridine2605 synthase